jgi:hypothetical protein
MASKVRRVECGWGGHFVCADMCLFRRNTHLEKDGVWVVVSTVGNMYMPNSNKASEISVGRFYETMVFLSDVDDNKYHDADVSKCIPTQGRWCIDKPNCDNEANDMHEAIVAEITERMESGAI